MCFSRFPYKLCITRRLTDKDFCWRLIACIILLALALNVHFFWTTDINPLDNESENATIEYYCIPEEKYKYFHESIWPLIDMFVIGVVPSVLILIGNIFIILTVYEADTKRKSMTRKNRSKMSTVTLTLLLISFMFLVTTTPFGVMLIILNRGDERPIIEFLFDLTMLWSYMNNAINFFLYMLSGKRFRRELLCLLLTDRIRQTLSLHSVTSTFRMSGTESRRTSASENRCNIDHQKVLQNDTNNNLEVHNPAFYQDPDDLLESTRL